MITAYRSNCKSVELADLPVTEALPEDIQNAIIKIFSIASVVFLPPTLVASVYGMNFEYMPELHSALGYPSSLLLMVVSAIVPFYFFRWKGWL